MMLEIMDTTDEAELRRGVQGPPLAHGGPAVEGPFLGDEFDDDEPQKPTRPRWMERIARSRTVRDWRRRLRWDRGWEEPILTSSAQAAAISPLLTRTHQQQYGVALGQDLLTKQAITGAPQALYQAGVVSATNVCIFGAIGSTKSTLAKTFYTARAIATGQRVAVFDRKQQWQDGTHGGEYLRAANRLGGAVLRFTQDRHPETGQRLGTQLNLLDPAIARSTAGEGSDTSPMGQDELLVMLAEATLERRLTSSEKWALNRAHLAARRQADTEGRVPVLRDVINALYTPTVDDVPGPRHDAGTPHLTHIGIVDDVEVARWGLDVALTLEQFCDDGIYAGFFDGQTWGAPTPENPAGAPLDLVSPRLLVIDTSAIPSNSLILSVVMTITASFLAARWGRMPGYKTLIVEEAYSADKLGAVPAVFRDLVKRSRGIGMGIVSIFHHVTDVEQNSPMWSLMREAEIVHIFRQDKDDDATALIEMYGLPDEMRRTITLLPKGVHLYLRGRLPTTIVRQFRTEWEAEISDTDEAMRFANLTEPTEVATDEELVDAVRGMGGHTRLPESETTTILTPRGTRWGASSPTEPTDQGERA